MAIYTEREVKINGNSATMEEDLYLYRNNKNISVYFTLTYKKSKFNKLDNNVLTQLMPSHAYVSLLGPNMIQHSCGVGVIENDKIKMTFTENMIDEETEVGDYTLVIDLYDQLDDSLVTLPPIIRQVHILERVTSVCDLLPDIPDDPEDLEVSYNAATSELTISRIISYDEVTGELVIGPIENITDENLNI